MTIAACSTGLCVHLLSRISCTVVRGLALEACRFWPRDRWGRLSAGVCMQHGFLAPPQPAWAFLSSCLARTLLVRVVRCMYFEH